MPFILYNNTVGISRFIPYRKGNWEKYVEEDFLYLQTSSKASGFVLDHRRLGGLAHDDQLLVGHHHHSRKLRKPHADVHETLIKQERKTNH